MKNHISGTFSRGISIFLIAFVLTTWIFWSVRSNVFTQETAVSSSVSSSADYRQPQVELSEPSVIESASSSSQSLSSSSSVSSKSSLSEPSSDYVVATVNADKLAFYILNEPGQKVILDLRSADQYQAGYVRTSTNYDISRFVIDDFDKSKGYVLICDDDICSDAKALAKRISQFVVSVEVLEGGFEAWASGGFRVVKD